MSHRYAVLGSGRQGTAAAYDIAQHGDAELILVADADLAQAQRAADRVNRLSGRPVTEVALIDVRDRDAVVALLTGNGIEAFVSGVPYFFNMDLAHAAIARRSQHGRLRRQHRPDPPPAGPRRGGQSRGHHPDARLRPGAGAGQFALRLHHEPVRRDPRPDHVRRRHPGRPGPAVELHPDLQHRGADQRVLWHDGLHPRRRAAGDGVLQQRGV